jgi:hypothetical protein
VTRKKREMETAARSVHIAADTIIMLTEERQGLRDALRDLLAYWNHKDDHGWTAADVKRLEEIRNLVSR